MWQWGDTPLHEAITNGREAVVRLLLEGGASPDVTNNVSGRDLFAERDRVARGPSI